MIEPPRIPAINDEPNLRSRSITINKSLLAINAQPRLSIKADHYKVTG
jgi:hypothetical protein